MERGFGFDVQAVCARVHLALTNANALILAGQAQRLLVIGAETFSRIMDWTDRSDLRAFRGWRRSAGAWPPMRARADNTDRGILSADLNSDGRFRDMLFVDGGVSTTGQSGKLRMQGNALFRQAVESLPAPPKLPWKKPACMNDDVDWIVPHQANIRIIQGTARKMGIPMDHVIVTVQDHGNTSAASIPLGAIGGGHQRPDQTRRSAGLRSDRRRIGLGLGRSAVVI